MSGLTFLPLVATKAELNFFTPPYCGCYSTVFLRPCTFSEDIFIGPYESASLLTQPIFSQLSNLQVIIGEWKGVYKLKCTSKSAVMKSYQSIPDAVLFAYKWHNIITLFGLYLGGVNILLSALSRCCDTRRRDANWREESIFMWRLTFNYVCEIRLGGGPRNVWKQHLAEQQLRRQTRMWFE